MKNALILGIYGTLGQSIAEKLAKEGYRLYGSYYEAKPAEDHDFDAEVFPLDMGDLASIDAFCEKLDSLDQIDFFTSTIASTLTLEKFEKINIDVFNKDFTINFFNYIYFLRKILPKMTEHSNIIVILTQMVAEPQKNFSPYITSKYALLGLTKCLAKEFESKQIRVNAVSPGKMNTNFLWKMDLNGKTVMVPRAIKEKQIQTQKFLSPDKVAEKISEIVKDETLNGENFLIT